MQKKERKEELRQRLLTLRSGITGKAYLQKSSRILSQLKSLEVFINATAIHCYVSMNERGEVNTHPLIKEMLAAEKQVVVPITNIADGTLAHGRLDAFDDLKKNSWGVYEPQIEKAVSFEQLDLIIVPMVGGDLQKNRIGYGKGFYDRFLDQVTCPTVGLLFDSCLVEEIPVEPFDIALDNLITDVRIID